MALDLPFGGLPGCWFIIHSSPSRVNCVADQVKVTFGAGETTTCVDKSKRPVSNIELLYPVHDPSVVENRAKKLLQGLNRMGFAIV